MKTQRAAPTDPLSLRDAEPIDPGATEPVEPRATITGGDDGGQPRTTVATDGGTTTTSTPTTRGELAVDEVHADAAGDDRENLNDEYVVFTNVGDEPLDLSGWTVEDEAGHTYTFPDGATLEPGATLTLHTGSGTDTATDLYWGAGAPVWNNGGDTIIVTNADGDRVLVEEYP